MSSEDNFFDLMTKMYAEMKEGFQSVNNRLGNVENQLSNVENQLGNVENRLGKVENRLNNVENRLDNVENRLNNVEKITLSIENKHGEKLQALFDGYIQNSDKLDRIEKEVSKHDEVILRKVNPK